MPRTSRRLPLLLIVALTALASLVLAACGGDDDGGDSDADPEQVLEETFNNDTSVDSGVFEVSIDVEAEGGSDAGTLSAGLGGPFQGEEGAFPKFDIEGDAELSSESQDFSGSAGITSTGDGAFVNFQDTDYEIPQDIFSEFSTNFLQLQARSEKQGGGNGNLLGSIGVDPTNWLTDVSNEGTEEVEGTETIHIAGAADVPKLLEDFKTIAKNAPQAAEQLKPGQLKQIDELAEIVEDAELNVYSGDEDRLLRKLEATLSLNPPEGGGDDAPESVTVKFGITLSEVNEPQEISGPSETEPLSELLGQFGLSEGSLGDIAGGAAGAGSAPQAEAPQAGGSPQAPTDDATAAYLECLSQAQGAAAVQECSALLEE